MAADPYKYELDRAVQALSLRLLVERNPGIQTPGIFYALDWSDRTLSRRRAALARAGLPLVRESPLKGQHSRWYAAEPTAERSEGDVLTRWVQALADGYVDLKDLSEADKIKWYREIPKLLMIGTPPWEPNDFVNAYVDGDRLVLSVPRQLQVNERQIRAFKEPLCPT